MNSVNLMNLVNFQVKNKRSSLRSQYCENETFGGHFQTTVHNSRKQNVEAHFNFMGVLRVIVITLDTLIFNFLNSPIHGG